MRAGLIEFRREIDVMRDDFVEAFCETTWAWFVEAALVSGKLRTPDMPAAWTSPRWRMVDPVKDVKGDLSEVRAGFATTPAKIRERGRDPAEVLEEQRGWVEEVDEAGLIFDSDPRRVSLSGGLQAGSDANHGGSEESGRGPHTDARRGRVEVEA